MSFPLSTNNNNGPYVKPRLGIRQAPPKRTQMIHLKLLVSQKNHPVSPGTGAGITYNSPGSVHNCSAFTKYSNIHFSGHFRNTPVPEARVPNLIPSGLVDATFETRGVEGSARSMRIPHKHTAFLTRATACRRVPTKYVFISF